MTEDEFTKMTGKPFSKG
ncbi:hypothetical protein NG880_14670 [Enterococcus faecalis]|nr:hypothetical protein [Enterococcus faecalis]MCO5494750.1 hypothetical protein [Enterococcus faecalis]MCO5500916.1 hypothetical protein [Enterococcus faecalis]